MNDHLPQADTRTVDTIADNVEVSVVIPCLNEAGTLDGVVRAALQALRARDIRGEVVVADNGSTDGSAAIAERAGARVV